MAATYAIIGSTGNCGSALIRNLLKSPKNKIHAYCRNQKKLHGLIPEVVDNKNVQVFAGSIYDVELITDCVRGTKAVFLVVTTNDNVPGCRLSQDSAACVIQALERIKAEAGPGLKLPKLILLSSATIDDHLARHMPGWFRPIMLAAASHVYEDLRLTEVFLRSHSNWVSTIFIKPAGLSVDVSRGHRLTLDEEESFISYLDLSAGMIEAAEDEEGSAWGRLSLFEYIEQGLKKNPDGPAVISMFQPAGFLNELISNNERVLYQPSGDLYFYNRPLEQPSCLTLTYRQLHRTSLKFAAGLLAEGVQPNSTMVMIIPNGAEYTILLWACVLLRITYVSLDPALLDVSGFTQLKQLLQTLKPQIVVAPDVSGGRFLQVAMSELQLPRPIQICLSHSGTATWKSLVDVAAKAAKFPADEFAIVSSARHDNPRRIHSIMFTSGTSGIPKGCPLLVSGMSHVLDSQAWLIDNEAGAFAVQQPHNSRGIAPAQTLQTWKAGGAVVMTGQSFSVRDSLEAIKQFGATFIVLTPPMVHEMALELTARPVDVRSVIRIQVGGDAVTKDVIVKCAALFPQSQICVNHGMTEGGGSFIWPFFKKPPSKIPFFGEICPLGMVAPGSSIRLWDTEKNCVAKRGQFGELHISSPSIISHYLGGRSEESFYNDGKGRWFNTGDIAIVDREGLVYILGRRKDLLKCAGVAIMPAIIESSIQAFTGASSKFHTMYSVLSHLRF
ncbi:AMP-dependent synthetase/ligase [Penicillium occitanis (nom. inval.)]|nr:AMP-dependent synthetase/ligase [Penicillium occitanis (nom. inval.)]PCG96249.1 hypothetical protein PENOC_073770 [Penicillium occitanis (nom. inval.)]